LTGARPNRGEGLIRAEIAIVMTGSRRRQKGLDSTAEGLRRTPRVPLHRPFFGEDEERAAAAVVASRMVQGGGIYLDRAEEMLRERTGARHALLMTSCSHALEAAASALDIRDGDEVIVPAWGFPTSASAFLRLGARIVFADSRRDDPEADLDQILRRLTPRTKVVVVVHYAGRPFDVDALRRELDQRAPTVEIVEDAAQAMDSRLRGRACGTLGKVGCISFHGTKNITCGEGGVLLTDDDELAHRVTLIREMGTDRRLFMRGETEAYSWRTLGSAFLPPETSAAILCAQLDRADQILARRRRLVEGYREGLAELASRDRLRLPPPEAPGSRGNGHIFWVLLPDGARRSELREGLAARGIESASHFHPLDSSPLGQVLLGGARPVPRAEAFHHGLLRLPIYPDLTDATQDRVISALNSLLG
jgi:dTDP-4-amino-4,6-dideoxygalactose transaminase